MTTGDTDSPRCSSQKLLERDNDNADLLKDVEVSLQVRVLARQPVGLVTHEEHVRGEFADSAGLYQRGGTSFQAHTLHYVVKRFDVIFTQPSVTFTLTYGAHVIR